MYNLFKDALILPHTLLKYRKKGFFFTLGYLMILALLMSLGTIVQMITFSGNSVLTTENTGCAYVGGELVCEGAEYDPNNEFALYGYAAYFVETGDLISQPNASRIVFQGSSFYLYVNGSQVYAIDLMIPADNSISFDQYMRTVTNVIRYGSGIYALLGNMVLLIGIALIATISFLRLVKFIRYKTILKLVLYALTPFAVILAFYNLLGFNTILFYVLMFISYRSVFALQQVMTRETMIHLSEIAMGKNAPVGETVETQAPLSAEEESADPEEPEEKEDAEDESEDSTDSD